MASPAPLLIVTFVFRQNTRSVALPHAVAATSAFLDSSVELPLAKACKFASIALLDRIWESSSRFAPENDDAAASSWCVRKLLRTDPHYKQFQFTQSLLEAVRRQELSMVRWLFAHFPGFIVVHDVVVEAAAAGLLETLRFFRENDNNSWADEADVAMGEYCEVQWFGASDSQYSEETAVAARNGHSNVVKWLFYQMGGRIRRLDRTLTAAVGSGDVQLVVWLLQHIRNVDLRAYRKSGIHDAAANGHVAMLQLLAFLKLDNHVSGVLFKAAEHGQLDVVRWILDRDRVQKETDSDVEASMTDLQAEACLSIHIAAANGHLEVAMYLFAQVAMLLNMHQRAQKAKQLEKKRTELIELFGWSLQAQLVSKKTMMQAAVNGFLNVAQWVYEQFGFCAEIDLFDSDRSQNSWLDMFCEEDTCAMDMAARYGHLEVVRYLHELWSPIKRDNLGKCKREEAVEAVEDVGCNAGFDQPDADDNTMGRQPDGPNTIPSCSQVAMDGAAANNHSDVIERVHNSRTEGCSSHAMDFAACCGHLEVVQWLHRNRTEGCTTVAMDGAASSGSLDLVEWLHTNRAEGCTTEAMDNAARKGHLEIVKWLHEHRSEGCTTAAMDGAASSGSLDVVKWLHANRAEGCTTKAMDLAARGGHLRVVQWLHENRSEGCTTAAMDEAALKGHFETVLFLHWARSEGCSEVAVTETWENGEPGIHTWVLENYPALQTVTNER